MHSTTKQLEPLWSSTFKSSEATYLRSFTLALIHSLPQPALLATMKLPLPTLHLTLLLRPRQLPKPQYNRV